MDGNMALKIVGLLHQKIVVIKGYLLDVIALIQNLRRYAFDERVFNEYNNLGCSLDRSGYDSWYYYRSDFSTT